ncbi:MAG: glycosyltransferase family 4 protein [Deltaproteobacteria bacterium]|nr:glycosyltransferase family 4 protein [Deltaproteobacteria bacterium]
MPKAAAHLTFTTNICKLWRPSVGNVATHHVVRTVAFLGNHPPRQCGIATFTADLSGAIQTSSPALDCTIVAMNDAGKHYLYPEKIRYQIAEESLASYRRAADFLNVSAIDVLSVQHEYGIYGGKAGAHLLTLLRQLRMPIVTTLHTVLANPNPSQRALMDELCALSERLIVMSERGAELLRRVHDVPQLKLEVIHHGVPVLPDCAASKKKLGLEGRRVLLTFGLLSPDKGIEYVIDALPEIRAHCADVLYIVLGATHPHVKEQHGEGYRLMLEARGQSLGVDSHLRFHDRFVSHAELVQFLAAADVYVTPYLNQEQITSGTLAYAVGAGKAVVSTPYRYAEEILADGRGRLVLPRSSSALATTITQLLKDSRAKADLERRALAFGGRMQWPVVAAAYLQCFERAFRGHSSRTSTYARVKAPREKTRTLPELNLDHLYAMTDDTGLLQHAAHAIPRYEDGYCLDDNARALLLMAGLEEARAEAPSRIRSHFTRYLAFVRHAFDAESGRFRNFMSYTRRWTERCGSEDSHGRALWALGVVGAGTGDSGRRAVATEVFENALPAVAAFTSPRAWAYALLGVAGYVRSHGHEGRVGSQGRELATRLLDLFRCSAHKDWPWCENQVTYCNARLSEALLLSGQWMGDDTMLATGLRSLDWLATIQTEDGGLFAPIGSDGFFLRGGTKADFDQQPVEACGAVAACLLSHRITGDEKWRVRAEQAFNWFLGRNQLKEWVYAPATGGCRDGLHRDRANENQGAESTLSFLMALLDMRQSDQPFEARGATRTTALGASVCEVAS